MSLGTNRAIYIWAVAVALTVAVSLNLSPWLNFGIFAIALTAILRAPKSKRTTLPIRLLLSLSLGVIAIRVLFRMLFSQANSLDAIAIDLPRFELNLGLGPIEFLGPVTWVSLSHAVFDGVRLSAIWLVFVAANIWADSKSLLLRMSGRFFELSMIVVLALNFVPQFIESAKRSSLAARMRGIEKLPWATRLSSALDSALEQSWLLAEYLDARGFGSARASVLTLPEHAGLEVRNLTVNMSGATPILSNLKLRIEPGQLVLITGRPGTGKSILLTELAGLGPLYNYSVVTGTRLIGGIDVTNTPARELARHVALSDQRFEQMGVAETVQGELEFVARLAGLKGNLSKSIDELAALMNIHDLLDRTSDLLSGGERLKLQVALTLLAKPRFVLLDGLHVRLDIESREAFLKMYRELAKSTGTSFVIVEVNDFADSNTRARFDQVVELGAEEAGVAKLSPRAALGDKKLTLTNLSAITGRRVLYKIDELVISRGQITCLTGTNGAGKSTLLRDLQTRLATDHQVTLLPEFSSDLLIFGTVGEELQNAASNAADLLKLLGFELPSVAHTRDLSSAQRLALSLCIQLAKPSQVLLLDEPSHAFSAETGGKLIDLLRDISSDRAIVVVSHDKNLIAAADRVLNLHDGRLTEVPR